MIFRKLSLLLLIVLGDTAWAQQPDRLTKGLILHPSDPVFEVNNLQRGEKQFREIFGF